MWLDRTLVNSQPSPQQSETRSNLPLKNQSVVSWQASNPSNLLVVGVGLARCSIRRSNLASTLMQYKWRLREDRGKMSQSVG